MLNVYNRRLEPSGPYRHLTMTRGNCIVVMMAFLQVHRLRARPQRRFVQLVKLPDQLRGEVTFGIASLTYYNAVCGTLFVSLPGVWYKVRGRYR